MSSNKKQSMINKGIKQTYIHNLLISKNTSNSNFARNDADKGRRQIEIIKKFSNQLQSKQTLNKKDLSVEFKQFANNAQEDEDSDDEINVMMLEANEPLTKLSFFTNQVRRILQIEVLRGFRIGLLGSTELI